MSHHRLTRRDIKRDEVLEGLSRSIEFSRRHARVIGLGALAALLVVLAVVGAGWWMRQRDTRANRALSEVLDREDAAQAGPEELRSIADKYGSTAPGSIALALAGEAAAAEGDLAAARADWEAFLDEAPSSMLTVNVRINLLELDRREGHGEEVEKELRAMLEDLDAPLPPSLARYQLGLTLESLGRPEEARAAYEQVIEEAGSSPVARLARERAQALGSSS